MWKNPDVGKCPCYPPDELLRTLDKVVDMIGELGQEYLAFDTGKFYKDVDKVMEESGFKKLGEGLTRLVYEFKDENNCDCVVKVAKSKDARNSNFNEMAVMIDTPPGVKKMFLGLGAADQEGWWVTQPKAKFPRRGERLDVLKQVEDELNEEGWYCYDLHTDNVGFYADRPVIVNYGFGLLCRGTKTYHGVKGEIKAARNPNNPSYYTKITFGPSGFKVSDVLKEA